MNTLVCVDIDQGMHSLVKKIKLLEMKNEKKLHRFSYFKNIANFEAFWRDKNFSKNVLFLGSGLFAVFLITVGKRQISLFETAERVGTDPFFSTKSLQ